MAAYAISNQHKESGYENIGIKYTGVGIFETFFTPAVQEELFKTCDVISIHSGMTPKTYQMVNAPLLAMMKDGELLVNTSRGAVIDEAALEEQAITGRLRAVLDVFEAQPLTTDSRLKGLDNVPIIPHCGGPTVDVRGILTDALIDDVVKCVDGDTNVPSKISMEYAKNMTSHIMVTNRSKKVKEK